MNILTRNDLAFYIFMSGFIFLIGILVSLSLNQPSVVPFNFNDTQASTMTSLEIFEYIMFRNLIATFLIMSLGVLGFRSIPALLVASNGYALGLTITQLNYNSELIFTIIFPHGYIEFPIIIFAGACSFILASSLQDYGLNGYTLLTEHKNPYIKDLLKSYLLYPYILLIVPWLLMAAIIESTITLWNLKILVGV